MLRTDREEIIKCITKCGLNTDYPIINNDMDNFIIIVYQTIFSNDSNKMSKLIDQINNILLVDEESYEQFIKPLMESNYGQVYKKDILDFPGTKYVADFCGMPIHAILPIWGEYLGLERIYYHSSERRSQKMRTKFMQIFIILCLRHIFTIVEYCIKYDLNFSKFTTNENPKNIIRHLNFLDMNCSIDSIIKSVTEIFPYENREFVKEMCTKYYNLYHTIEPLSTSEIDEFLSKNVDFILDLEIKNTDQIKNTVLFKENLRNRIFNIDILGYSFVLSRECPEPLIGLNTNTNQIRLNKKFIIEI